MEGYIFMSKKDLNRLEILAKVQEKRLTITQAIDILNLSKRQILRLSKAFKNEGAKGIISKKVGAPSNHQLSGEIKNKTLNLILEFYPDFGPTLAHEYLTEKHDLEISVGSVRNIMIEHGIWVSKRKRKERVFQLRERRPREGELIQVDGSPDHWLEDRGPDGSLLSYVDDATGKIMILMLAESENLEDYLLATKEYLQKFGRPGAFYPDKHGVFRVNQEGALTGTGMTQFGRAMKELDIQLICANTPQAKGRVERRHRDLQDRLIKALRLQKISTIEEANAFLPSFIEDFNKRFAKPAKDSTNAHRPLLETHDLDRILCKKNERCLSKNLILQYNNVIYQIIPERPSYVLRKKRVVVLESIDGRISIEYNGKPLKAVPYHQMHEVAPIVSSKELAAALVPKEKKTYRPGNNHPWKRGPRGFSNKLSKLACSY